MADPTLGFGGLEQEFGARADVPTLHFGVVPSLPDEKDEYRKTEHEIHASLAESSEIWTPSSMPSQHRLRLSRTPAFVDIGGAPIPVGIIDINYWPKESIENTPDQLAAQIRNEILGDDGVNLYLQTWARTGGNPEHDENFFAQMYLHSEITQRPTINFLLNSDATTGALLVYELIGAAGGDPVAISQHYAAQNRTFRRDLSGDDVLATGVVTVLDFDAEDQLGSHDNFPGFMSGTGSFTIGEGWHGIWEFFAGVQWASGSVGVRVLQIQLNGTGVADIRFAPIGTTVMTCSTGPIEVAVDNVIRVIAQHTQGANLNAVDSALTFFGGRYIGHAVP